MKEEREGDKPNYFKSTFVQKMLILEMSLALNILNS